MPTHAGVGDDGQSGGLWVVSGSGVDHLRVDIAVGKDFEAEHVVVSEMVHNRRTFYSCLVSMAEDCVKVRDRPVVGLLVPDYGASHPCGDCLGGVCSCVRREPVKFEVEFDGFVPDIATDPVP